MQKIVIEHLEPRLWKWCLVEYKHISDHIGSSNLIFTNIKSNRNKERLSNLGQVYGESVKELNFNNACVLDPGAKETLTPQDRFDYVILGGILGDFPMKHKTKKELTSKLDCPSRNLGRNQMSTNTAAIVAWKILKGTPLRDMKFIRKLVVKIKEGEEIILPFKFLIENKKVVLPENYIELVKS